MNINSQGSKAIYYKGAAITAGVIGAGDIATFIYNGSQYILLAIDTKATSSCIDILSSDPVNPVNGYCWITESES
jgi:hypothetical protein